MITQSELDKIKGEFLSYSPESTRDFRPAMLKLVREVEKLQTDLAKGRAFRTRVLDLLRRVKERPPEDKDVATAEKVVDRNLGVILREYAV